MLKKFFVAPLVGVLVFLGIGVLRHVEGTHSNFHLTHFPVAENLAVGTFIGVGLALLLACRKTGSSPLSVAKSTVFYSMVVFAGVAIAEHFHHLRTITHAHVSAPTGVSRFLAAHNFHLPTFHLSADLTVAGAAAATMLLALVFTASKLGAKQLAGAAKGKIASAQAGKPTVPAVSVAAPVTQGSDSSSGSFGLELDPDVQAIVDSTLAKD